MNKVSIIIPIYNSEQYLSVCIDSVISQSYNNIEVICIDDGSKDNSASILDEYKKKDCRIVVVHQKNAGVSAVRNRAMEIATGDYVMFVDSDDWIDHDAIEKTLLYSIENELDICSFSYISEHGRIQRKHALYQSSQIFDEELTRNLARRIIGPIGKELRQPLMLDSYGTIWAKLYKRTAIKGLKFEDLKIIGTAEDSLFNMFAYHKAKRTGYYHKFFYHYRKTNASAETKRYRPWLKDRWKVQYEIIRKSFPNEECQHALNSRIAINHYGLTENLMKSNNPRKMIKDVFGDAVFSYARKSLKTKDMSLIWKVFFGFVKHGNVNLVVIFHKAVSFILKIING